jgi:hypothetical protein
MLYVHNTINVFICIHLLVILGAVLHARARAATFEDNVHHDAARTNKGLGRISTPAFQFIGAFTFEKPTENQ